MSTSSLVNEKGEFVRKPSSFRNFITADGSSGYPAEPNRYHLYISYVCPWAHRTLLLRSLKGLEDVIGFTAVHWCFGENGWEFSSDEPDPNLNAKFLRELYFHTNKDYEGRFSVPVLWDKKTQTIVNNESSEIIRMLNTEFNAFAKNPNANFYPDDLKTKIDEVNDWVYSAINNGVYRAGFAESQEAYEKACHDVFDALDRVEEILSKQRYLAGDRLTEADVRLYPTLIRFDVAYVGLFKCNKKRILEYPNIWNYLKELYQIPAFKSTTNFDHIKKGYYLSKNSPQKVAIVPVGPEIDFDAPHNRNRL